MMEVRAVAEALLWLESQNNTHVCILSDFVYIPCEVQGRMLRQQWQDPEQQRSHSSL